MTPALFALVGTGLGTRERDSMANMSHVHLARLCALGHDCARDYIGMNDSEVMAIRSSPDFERTLDCGLLLRADADARVASYIMSTERPVGPFGDIVVVNGWDLRDFRKRGQPFLFGHDSRAFPIGNMRAVTKSGQLADGSPALVGDGHFAPEGLNDMADRAWGLVKARILRGGSVGFRILQSRAPTTDELQSVQGLHKHSFIAEKARLIEFSAVSVGMDPDALVVSTGKKRAIDDDYDDTFDFAIDDDELADVVGDVSLRGPGYSNGERELIDLGPHGEAAVGVMARTLADAYEDICEAYGIDTDDDDPDGGEIAGGLDAILGAPDEDGDDVYGALEARIARPDEFDDEKEEEEEEADEEIDLLTVLYGGYDDEGGDDE